MSGNDLDILEPPCGEVTFRGERLEIRPLVVEQLPKFTRCVRPIFKLLLDRDLADGDDDGVIVDLLIDVVADHGEAAIEAAAIVTGKPVEWIGAGDPDEFIDLVRMVLAVNRDFFARRIAPRLVGLAVPQSSNGGGPTPSSN